MRTYYCSTLEEALRRAKRAGKQPGCHYGGITLPSGRKAFAIYRDGKVVEKYTAGYHLSQNCCQRASSSSSASPKHTSGRKGTART